MHGMRKERGGNFCSTSARYFFVQFVLLVVLATVCLDVCLFKKAAPACTVTFAIIHEWRSFLVCLTSEGMHQVPFVYAVPSVALVVRSMHRDIRNSVPRGRLFIPQI